jgi:2-octaprenyl-6-methoxyphenol hydroxylase
MNVAAMAKEKRAKSEIIIVGAGAVGLVAALLLSKQGFLISLLEQGDPKDKFKGDLVDGHTTALMNNSLSLLKRCDVWDDVEPYTQAMDVLRIKEQSGAFEDFKASDIGKKTFGRNVPQTPLRAFLLKKVKQQKNITYVANAQLTTLDKGVVQTSKGIFEAALIIGCDGRNSFCRQAAGIETIDRVYEQTALTFLVDHSLPHHNTSTEIHKIGGPLTFVPLPHNQSSVVWVHKAEDAEAVLKLKKQELQQRLQDQSLGILGALEIKTAIASWPLTALYAKKLSAPRLVLIGETAHGYSPVGAQGLNVSMRDIDALVDMLVEARRLGQDMGSEIFLARYARSRKVDTLKRFYGVDGLNFLIRTENSMAQNIREKGIKFVSQIKPLKRFFMRQGMSSK